MTEKPTFASVTSEPCTCGHLERASLEPDVPVEFDEALGEYHLTSGRPKTYSLIYHCFFCGGVAPPSRRESQFAHLTGAESMRLRSLTADVTTVAEALSRFGPPDEDRPAAIGRSTAESAGEPSKMTWYRTLTFRRLSETADVLLVDYTPDPVRFTFAPKYLGPTKHEG